MVYKVIHRMILVLALFSGAAVTHAQEQRGDYQLGSGDAIHISVFQKPEMTIDTQISEKGFITYPMVGAIEIGGLTIGGAGQKISTALESGGFIHQPQVNISLVQIKGNQVSVLGQVNRPGRFPLDTRNTHLSEMLAIAGGVTAMGADIAVITGIRNGKPIRNELDIASMFLDGNFKDDVLLENGDEIFIHRYPVFYVYGEVQRPGSYRVERNMTVIQAIAQGGGPTLRGTERSLKLTRREANGKIEKRTVSLTEMVKDGDVLYVSESLF